MFKRIKSGWQLTKKSWQVLSGDPGLVKFPLVGGAISLLIVVLVIGPSLYLFEQGSEPVGIALFVVGAYLAAFAGTYFSVGLAHNADQRMHGERPGFGDGMAVARSRFSQVAGWAFLSTFVMTVIRAIQERFGILGAIFGGLAAAAWGILTFLAIPVIAIEGTGPIATVKRCAHLVKSRWGQQITGVIAIGGVIFIVGFLPAVLLAAGGVALWATTGVGGAVLIAIGVALFAVSALVLQSLSTIFGVALYRYVATEETVGGFTGEELENAVRTKKGSRPGGAAPAASTI